MERKVTVGAMADVGVQALATQALLEAAKELREDVIEVLAAMAGQESDWGAWAGKIDGLRDEIERLFVAKRTIEGGQTSRTPFMYVERLGFRMKSVVELASQHRRVLDETIRMLEQEREEG